MRGLKTTLGFVEVRDQPFDLLGPLVFSKNLRSVPPFDVNQFCNQLNRSRMAHFSTRSSVCCAVPNNLDEMQKLLIDRELTLAL